MDMQMNSMYEDAIRGKLVAKGGGEVLPQIPVSSRLPIPVALYGDGFGGRTGVNPETRDLEPGRPPAIIPPYGGGEPKPVMVRPITGAYLVFTSALSGAFVAVVEVTAETREICVSSWHLLEPNDIGMVPEPDAGAGIYIPDDSQPIVVGCGVIENVSGPVAKPNIVIREQFWEILPNSYSIAPGEEKRYSLQITSGMQSTTSDQQSVEASIGASAGVGWGPVSASVSAALSASSATSQQVVMSEEATENVSNTYTLDEERHSHARMVIRWQLSDRVTLYDGATVLSDPGKSALSSVVVNAQPTLVSASEILP
ncbi:hypothetical protein ACWGNE_00385 [Streptomyces xiamenensis]|uniref:hypothetical protein n=1 Tax=Streptomyces xiamenensis TaxID=408015 RepID=UPI0036A7AC87